MHTALWSHLVDATIKGFAEQRVKEKPQAFGLNKPPRVSSGQVSPTISTASIVSMKKS